MFSWEVKYAKQRGEDEGASLEGLFMEVQQNEEEFKSNDPVFANTFLMLLIHPFSPYGKK